MSEAVADIGVLGLGTMGGMLALNLAEKGFATALHNRTAEKARRLVADNPALAARLHPSTSLHDFVARLKAPRLVLLMVEAGPPVDEQIAALMPLLSQGDILIDAGNADFNDTVRRSRAIEGTGLRFVGMGVSGGASGARHGPSIMVGGEDDVWRRLQPVLEAIAARYEGEPCVARLGPDGAGHFVKTIHNGIEYADMQMIAEIYGILRDGAQLEPGEMAAVFADWNTRGLSSYLVEITAAVLAERDPDTGRPLVDLIVDEAGQKGTGRWSVIEAQKLGIGATTLEAAVSARGLSSRRAEREAASRVYAGIGAKDPDGAFPVTPAGLRELESALQTAKIIAYAQGYAVMAAASEEFGWALPLRDIARIWRAGCIIRSVFLDDIARAFEAGDGVVNLLQAPSLAARVAEGEGALRRIVSKAALAGLPVPALAAALSYFDDYRRVRGTANLVQGQRDFFGAHTFQRFDRPGRHHHAWAGG
ncbi:NADP-dependent phosphogluconate dehydrogenase [Aurantimonas sp. Leaf443]|uniref:NADP-dependent phosphogluconate dehydrogenase n=1 Tax=Aurantimonas sp. Leaf443 TaxID=1736378 RepID=UPI0006FA22BD|nr:NADP-dependent phosphogluconate dehydrogenase [Aurantimonas sp. Leaf443]KQT85433.1 6-phosphogluconate dehydrogenase [Aurantimonas sp. Leaf443]